MGAIAEDFKAMTDTPEKPKHKTWKERLRDARDRIEKPRVDFAAVPPSQWDIHDRLLNWARASRGGDKQTGAASPMFTLYRSGDARRAYGEETNLPVNRSDAILIAKGVYELPDKHRKALHWYYIHSGSNPVGAARDIAVTLEALAELVRDGRQMLINRKV